MAKTFAWIFGIVFLLVGLLGFISNPIVGDTGYFHTDLVHNLVHLISGILFIWVAAAMPEKSKGAMKIFGVVYLLVAILGFFMIDASGMGSILGLIGINSADNWLHVALGVVIFAAGALSSNDSAPMTM